MIRKSATMTRQGIAPWRGTGELFEAEPFFLILVAAIQERLERTAATGAPFYFLKRLSNAARASSALRGAATFPLSPTFTTGAEGSTSRATVTRGEKSWHVFAWSFMAMRSGIGFRHWKRVEESKCTHCLQQCSAAPHFGQFPLKSMSGGRVTAQLKHREATTFWTRRGSLGPVISMGGRGPCCFGLSKRE